MPHVSVCFKTAVIHWQNAVVFALGLFLALGLGCKSGSGGGGSPGGSEPADGVRLFTSAESIKQLTGADDVDASSLAPAANGELLTVEGSSSSVLRFSTNGTPFTFTFGEALEDLTGDMVMLGPLDEIRLGAQQGHFVCADTVSGVFLRLEANGTPRIHSTEDQIKAVTGRGSARISLPRFLLNNQVIAQELVTGDILLFGTSGVAQPFVGVVELAAAAGLLPAETIVDAWTQGGGTLSQFARFVSSNNIVRVELDARVTRHVDASRLRELFPTVMNLRVSDFVCDPASDAMVIVVASDRRGVALAFVEARAPFAVSVLTSEEEFTEVLGEDYDISDIGVLTDGSTYAIDRVGIRVLVIGSEGVPFVAAERDSIERESGTDSPQISKGVRLGQQAVIVPEDTTGNVLQVQ